MKKNSAFIDKELIDTFSTEIKDIEKNLKSCVSAIIETKMKENVHFENFGQYIDRIYGTASTLGFVEIADYSRSLKEVCYKCSQSDSDMGKEKTMRLMIEFLNHMSMLISCIHNPEEVKRIQIKIKVEQARAERLCRSVFYSIKKSSCG